MSADRPPEGVQRRSAQRGDLADATTRHAAAPRAADAANGTDKPPFGHLWRALLTARAMLALAVLLLQLMTNGLISPSDWRAVAVAAAYACATAWVRFTAPVEPPHGRPGPAWLATLGVDLLAIAALQALHLGNLNYAPLFGLPVLMAATLGSLALALGTAAAATLLLLIDAWLPLATAGDTSGFLQAGVTGASLFLVALLVRQLSGRLALEMQVAERSQAAAALQREVNALVLEALTDGALVVDESAQLIAANPAARRMLGLPPGEALATPEPHTGWQQLAALVRRTHATGQPQQADIALHGSRRAARRLQVRTGLAHGAAAGGLPDLCVVFLQDLRELEARLRTEKLAAMGRMSVAVAHEIRNPLSAIVQANALLDEELDNPGHKHLAALVAQNAQRLARIAEEVLDLSRARPGGTVADDTPAIALDATVAQVCGEWTRQQQGRRVPQLVLAAPGLRVGFDPEHLRRVLVNLLDNAARYADAQDDAIQVVTSAGGVDERPALAVWSDGAPLEDSVERHLFEPFFSSESRSTGLGLYICRELCERHGAAIRYQRNLRPTQAGAREGNSFTILLRPAAAPVSA